MISVVLPCFNEEASIQKNIDSIKKELDQATLLNIQERKVCAFKQFLKGL